MFDAYFIVSKDGDNSVYMIFYNLDPLFLLIYVNTLRPKEVLVTSYWIFENPEKIRKQTKFTYPSGLNMKNAIIICDIFIPCDAKQY